MKTRALWVSTTMMMLAATMAACSADSTAAAPVLPEHDEVDDLTPAEYGVTDAEPDLADEADMLGDLDDSSSTADVDGVDAADDPNDADAVADENDDPTLDAPSDGVAIQSNGGKSSRPPNVGFGGRWRGNKVGATLKAACNGEPLRYLPSAKGDVVKDASGNGATLATGRAVLVQMAPGARGGFVWVDPDVISMSAAREKQVFGHVIPPPNPRFGVRGWARAECFERGVKGEAFPKKHVLYPAGDARPIKGGDTPMIVKANADRTAVVCDVKAKYKKAGGSSYANYAAKNGYSKGVYLNYNTVGALYQGTVRGGGMTLGYVAVDETFHVVAKVDDRIVARNKKVNPKKKLDVNFPGGVRGVDDYNPGVWGYGYVERGGGKDWGYVYYDCLTPGTAAAPTQAGDPEGDSCIGKADGTYCGVLQDMAYECTNQKFSGGQSCPSGQFCKGADASGQIICR